MIQSQWDKKGKIVKFAIIAVLMMFITVFAAVSLDVTPISDGTGISRNINDVSETYGSIEYLNPVDTRRTAGEISDCVISEPLVIGVNDICSDLNQPAYITWTDTGIYQNAFVKKEGQLFRSFKTINKNLEYLGNGSWRTLVTSFSNYTITQTQFNGTFNDTILVDSAFDNPVLSVDFPALFSINADKNNTNESGIIQPRDVYFVTGDCIEVESNVTWVENSGFNGTTGSNYFDSEYIIRHNNDFCPPLLEDVSDSSPSTPMVSFVINQTETIDLVNYTIFTGINRTTNETKTWKFYVSNRSSEGDSNNYMFVEMINKTGGSIIKSANGSYDSTIINMVANESYLWQFGNDTDNDAEWYYRMTVLSGVSKGNSYEGVLFFNDPGQLQFTFETNTMLIGASAEGGVTQDFFKGHIEYFKTENGPFNKTQQHFDYIYENYQEYDIFFEDGSYITQPFNSSDVNVNTSLAIWQGINISKVFNDQNLTQNKLPGDIRYEGRFDNCSNISNANFIPFESLSTSYTNDATNFDGTHAEQTAQCASYKLYFNASNNYTTDNAIDLIINITAIGRNYAIPIINGTHIAPTIVNNGEYINISVNVTLRENDAIRLDAWFYHQNNSSLIKFGLPFGNDSITEDGFYEGVINSSDIDKIGTHNVYVRVFGRVVEETSVFGTSDNSNNITYTLGAPNSTIITFTPLNSSKGSIGDESSFNVSNLQSIEYMNISFDISDPDGIEDVGLFFTANGTNGCALGNNQSLTCYNIQNGNWVEYKNGTNTSTFRDIGQQGDYITCDYTGTSINRTYNCQIDEHYNPNVFKHYPLDFTQLKWQNASGQRLNNNKVWLFNVTGRNIPIDAEYYKLDFRAEIVNNPTQPLVAFMCNTTYNTGNPETDQNCAQIASKIPPQFQDDGTKFRQVFTNSTIESLGDFGYIAILTDSLGSKYYAMKTFVYDGDESVLTSYSADSGASYTPLADGYESEININWFSNADSPTTLMMTTWYNDSLGNGVNYSSQDMTWQMGEYNLPPIVNILSPEQNSTVSGNVLINFTANDPNEDSIRYTVFLINQSDILDIYPLGVNMPEENTSFYFNSSTYFDGIYDLRVTATENETGDAFTSSNDHQITISNTVLPPVPNTFNIVEYYPNLTTLEFYKPNLYPFWVTVNTTNASLLTPSWTVNGIDQKINEYSFDFRSNKYLPGTNEVTFTVTNGTASLSQTWNVTLNEENDNIGYFIALIFAAIILVYLFVYRKSKLIASFIIILIGIASFIPFYSTIMGVLSAIIVAIGITSFALAYIRKARS